VRLVKLLILVFIAPLLSAQPYGNEWIDYSQKYYQFKISSTGVYKIDYQTLLDANIPLSTINPANFQLFAKGQEQPIYIEGGGDGVFDPTDYILLYAQHNDGWLDTAFYKGSDNQPNPYYSLINDTLIYYLSWNNQQNNLRYQEENAIDFNNYFSAPYVWKTSLEFFNSNYYDGEILTGGATDPEYAPTEGYMDRAINIGQQRNYSLRASNIYRSGPAASFEFKLAGASDWAPLRNGDHHLRLSIGNLQFDKIFEGYQLLHLDTTINVQSLVNGNNAVRVQSIDDLSTQSGRVDRMALAYMKLTYPHNLDFTGISNVEFEVDDNGSQNGQYLEFNNFNGGSNPILIDLTNHKKIRLIQGINNFKAIIPNGNGRKKCLLTSASSIQEIKSITQVGSSGQFIDYQSMLSDSVYLMITHSKLEAAASTYAAFRRSKGHKVLMVDIDELYHQFGFGIEKNPLSIRNFIDIVKHQWTKEISNLFILGKSVSAKAHRKNASAYEQNLVPTMGSPAADNLLTAGLGSTFLEPLVPQGRLSAKSNIEIDNYLSKVVAYESANPDIWMKNALHFAGGNSANETERYVNYLRRFGQDFSNAPMGGNVKIFKKSTTSPYQTTLSDSIRTLINKGVSLMTFFGHASATGDFDISIDSPDKLQNTGKYPIILANSCFSGNYHQDDAVSTAEAYVLEKDRGSIGFIANGNLGMPYALSVYSTALYQQFSKDYYGESWAKSMQAAVKKVQGPNIDHSLKIICLDMALQGDPALKPYSFSLPDYRITAENVKISPNDISTSLKNYSISVKVENIGRATRDSLAIQLHQKFPLENNQDTVYTKVIGSVFYDSIIEFVIPIYLFKSTGINKFTIIIDPLNQVKESSKLNNRYDFEINIRSGEILPIYPPKYSIVGSLHPTLKASTVYAFEENRVYNFELDNTPDFNSSWKSTYSTQSKGGVVQWRPAALAQMQDSMVYYWRISKAVEAGEIINWQSSSFQYIPEDSGWSQSDFGQYVENNQLFINANRSSEKFEFTNRSSELYVKTYGQPTIGQVADVQYRIDTDVRERNGCGGGAGFFVAVLDSLTLQSMQTPYNGQNSQNYFGQANFDNYCGANRQRSENYFLFRQNDSLQMIAMRDFIKNEIPKGSYVVIYNWFQINYSSIWQQDSSVLKAIEDIGSTRISTLQDGHPFIFTAKKGDFSSVIEVSGDSVNDVIELSRVLITTANYGKMITPKIGPSEKWTRLSYQFDKLENPSADSLIYTLVGTTREGNTHKLLSSSNFKMDTTLSFVGDSIHSLNMEVTTYDEVSFTPPQLRYWQLNFKEAVDFAVAPNLFFEQEKDTVERGEPLKFKYAVECIGESIEDSLLVVYTVLQNGTKKMLEKKVMHPPIFKDSLNIIEVEIPTRMLEGNNILKFEINPENKPAELHRFNNYAQLGFYVATDQLNPIIDLTVDGRRIMNRELISAEPEFVISLKDENNFLAIEDTSSLAIFIRKPNGKEEAINYQSVEGDYLSFTPAVLPENKAKVIYRPKLKQDGLYQLRIQAKDASGNAAMQDYKVEFEVLNQSTVTRMLNYPNPFSTSTRFVFTLTGSQIPDQIQIQIMTITGKVVREIDQFELGPIHIGNNITQYAWDGKDEFGDQLANGVYLYRVKMKIFGKNIDHRDTSIDKYFKKNFGKMYLLR